MSWIRLGHGRVAAVDREDFRRLNAFKWVLMNRKYAGRRIHLGGRKFTHEYLQQAVLGLPPGQDRAAVAITFDNDDTLDCRKCNLVVEPKVEQLQRKRPMQNRTGFHGVVARGPNRYIGKITPRGVSVRSEIFSTAEAAARARDLLARMWLPGSRMNFPRDGELGFEVSAPPAARRSSRPARSRSPASAT